MAAPVHLAPGVTFARDFHVIRPLAEGGMGAVYVVLQASTGKERALKIMHPQLVADLKARERFMQEARIGGQIKGDHVVEVVGAGIDEDTGAPWLAMELLEGEDLAAVAEKRAPLPPGEVLEIFEQLGDALGQAHARGIVHRDLKPENLFVEVSRRRGVPFTIKLLDFGIAKLIAENKVAATVTSAIGSPLWMAPEQANLGAKVRPSTDVWALGLIAFRLLTGYHYWRGADVREGAFNLSALLAEVLVLPLETASARAAAFGYKTILPAGFDDWFALCVTREQADRFGDSTAALGYLRKVLMLAPQAPAATPATPTRELSPAEVLGIEMRALASAGTASAKVAILLRIADRCDGSEVGRLALRAALALDPEWRDALPGLRIIGARRGDPWMLELVLEREFELETDPIRRAAVGQALERHRAGLWYGERA